MANRVAPYKDKYFLDNFEHWWEQEATTDFITSDQMYVSYVEHQIGDREYEAILGYDDFMRVAYKCGVRKIGWADESPYKQSASWRPSDDMVMRHDPRIQLWEPYHGK